MASPTVETDTLHKTYSEKGSEESAITSSESSKERVIPGGGSRAWTTLGGAWLAVAATFGYTYAFGIYQDLFTREHAASAMRVSWIGSTQLFLIIATGGPAGKLYDMGHFRFVVGAGSVLFTTALFMVSLADPRKYYQIFLSQGIAMGIGGGMVYIPSLAVQAEHWPRRTLVMGIVSSGVPVGGTFFPIMLNQLLRHGVSYEKSVRASAFVVLAMLFVANILMSSSRRRSTTKNQEATKMKELFTDVPYMGIIIGGLLMDLGIFFPYFYLQLYTILHGMDPNFAFYTLTIMNGAGFLGRIIPNLLAEKYGAVNMLTASSTACAILLWAFFGLKSVAAIVVFSLLYGFFAGAWISLLSPAVSNFSKNERDYGIRIGFASMLASFTALTGTPIDGKLLGNTFPWDHAITFSAVRWSECFCSHYELSADYRRRARSLRCCS
ncbi:MFS general substrate transporter [Auriscalpium vulgare]|uniref:MFS general substrate transporter n=1 Tax=Auriscalpium vulgare TaxID=40419 RepID=A0ACB8RTN1_9AGAM|nr:MFS general substrate transporter [Auriscalpium vulgare]